MAENINGGDLLGSGGHTWIWGPRALSRKILRTAAVAGAYAYNTCVGERAGRIAGRDGGPAWLVGASDAALSAIEADIEALLHNGTVCAWEDDAGRSGASLMVTEYQRVGERQRAVDGGSVWQQYTLSVIELAGGF